MKTFDDYSKEHRVLLDMLRCSTRYLNSAERQNVGEEQQKIDRELEKDFRNLYNKYSEKINKKCLKKTGRTIS